MPKYLDIVLPLPLKGLDEGWARHAQPGESTPDCLNVYGRDRFKRRRLAQRPGLVKTFNSTIGILYVPVYDRNTGQPATDPDTGKPVYEKIIDIPDDVPFIPDPFNPGGDPVKMFQNPDDSCQTFYVNPNGPTTEDIGDGVPVSGNETWQTSDPGPTPAPQVIIFDYLRPVSQVGETMTATLTSNSFACTPTPGRFKVELLDDYAEYQSICDGSSGPHVAGSFDDRGTIAGVASSCCCHDTLEVVYPQEITGGCGIAGDKITVPVFVQDVAGTNIGYHFLIRFTVW